MSRTGTGEDLCVNLAFELPSCLDPSGLSVPVATDEKPPGILRDSGGLELVAGTGFEPATFGL